MINKEDPTLHLRQLDAGTMDAAAQVCIVPDDDVSEQSAVLRPASRIRAPDPARLGVALRERPTRAHTSTQHPAVRTQLHESLVGRTSARPSCAYGNGSFYQVVEVGPAQCEELKRKTIGEISKAPGTDAYSTWMDLLVESRFDIGYAIAFYPGEDNWVSEAR